MLAEIIRIFETHDGKGRNNVLDVRGVKEHLRIDDPFELLHGLKSVELTTDDPVQGQLKSIIWKDTIRLRSLFNYSRTRQIGLTAFGTHVESCNLQLQEIITGLNKHFYPRNFNAALSISTNSARIHQHADDADVLIVQLKGQRNWKIHSPEVLDKHERSDILWNRRRTVNRALDPDHQLFTLNCEDALYISALAPHEAESSVNDEGIVISLSIIGELLTNSSFAYLFPQFKLVPVQNPERVSQSVIQIQDYIHLPAEERVPFLRNLLVERNCVSLN